MFGSGGPSAENSPSGVNCKNWFVSREKIKQTLAIGAAALVAASTTAANRTDKTVNDEDMLWSSS